MSKCIERHRGILKWIFLSVATVLTSPSVTAEPYRNSWQLSLKSDRHSDALPLDSIGADNWAQQQSPRPGRNLTYVEEEVRLSRQQNVWTISILARSSATLIASEEAISLAAQLSRKQQSTGNAHWDNDVLLRGFSGIGAEVSRRHVLSPQWTASWSTQGLLLTRWREHELKGPVDFTAVSGTYAFDLTSNELNNSLIFPFQQKFDPRGVGLLFSGELAWQGEHLFAALNLRDGGWLHWSRVPQQKMALNTSTQALDADGFLIYRPLIQGQNSQSDATRIQAWRTSINAGWKLMNNQSIGLSVEHLPDFGVLPAVQWRQKNGNLQWGLDWRAHERRATVLADWDGWRLRLGADRLSSDARSREFSLSYLVEY